MALIMYFSIGNAYKINRFYATASSACKQLAINISVTLRHTGQCDQFNYCNNKLLSVWLLWTFIPTVMKTFISMKGYNETMHICVKIKILSCSGIYLNIPHFEDFLNFLKNLIYIEYNISINIHGKIMYTLAMYFTRSNSKYKSKYSTCWT